MFSTINSKISTEVLRIKGGSMKNKVFSLVMVALLVVLIPTCSFVNIATSIAFYCEGTSNSINNTYSSNLSSYDSYLVSYFDNLTENFGYNYKGSCGYVALGMILSYYDTYWDDSIIPEQYDVNSVGTGTNMITRRNSPGVMRDYIYSPDDESDYAYGYDLTAEQYLAEIESKSSVSLHAKLISIGNELGYYDIDNDDGPAGLFPGPLVNVLKEYLTAYRTFIDYTNFQLFSGYSPNPDKVRVLCNCNYKDP